MSEYGLARGQCEDFRNSYVGFVPFEDEEPSGFEDTEALFKSFFEDVLPAVGRKEAVLDHLPVPGFFLAPRVLEMRRVEDHHAEGAVPERECREVGHHVRMDMEFPLPAGDAGVLEHGVQFALVTEEDSRVFLVEVEHLPAAADVKDWR